MELKSHYSIAEFLEMELEGMPGSKVGWGDLVKRQSWAFQEVAAKGGRGGVKKIYAPPPEIMQQITERYQQQILAQQANTPFPVLDRLPEAPEKPDLSGSTEAQRTQLGAREAVLKAIETLMAETKVGKDAAITTFLTSAQHPSQAHLLKMLVLATDKRGRTAPSLTLPHEGRGMVVPNARTVKRWFKQRDENRLMAKIPQSKWQIPDWYPRFLHFFRQPQKPSVQAAYDWWVAVELAEQPLFKPPSIHAVRRMLDKTGEVEKQCGRMGARELKSQQAYVRREWRQYMPLEIVCADGQCFDAECGHPDNPSIAIRPEVTLIVDIGTRKIVGVGMGLAESGRAVRSAIRFMVTRYGICAIFYADNGKGYTNGLLNDDATGLFARLGITMKHSAPYSSQARGVVERLHKTVLIKTAKRLQTYIGQDMDGEASRAVHKATRQAAKQEIALRDIPALKNIASLTPHMMPSWEQMKEIIYQAVEEYNNSPHRSMEKVRDVRGNVRHMTPNELWAMKEMQMQSENKALEKVGEDEQMYVFLPQEIRTIERCQVKLRNNVYFNKAFEEWNGCEVRVAYDEHNAERVWLFDDVGRYLGHMDWNANVRDFFPKSVVEQAKDKRIDAQVKRLETKISVVEAARPVPTIEHQQSVNLGGLVVDLNNIKREAETVLLPRAEPKTDRLPEAQVDVPKQPVWQVPATPQERIAEWHRLNEQPHISEAQQRWLTRYPQSHEFKALNRNVA
ncbi:MAG: Mu transposase C-terminal domain-containing protein [Alysiella sp.]|uniref:Mu transposase C-terminal domain-containing protein n=1 Tax=Alysiella sp. TaxID=1872483 RepID=UPI0026DADF0C|nr:Mu transposase C-terminal domain-containing protein [Alysiella sp.]MDO4434747.1 Mu transposase C-terminal domain-containing protein [Alysiella sp.]